MIVVVVGDQHKIDRRQVVEGDARRRVAPDPHEAAERPAAVGPVRIGKERHAVDWTRTVEWPIQVTVAPRDPSRRAGDRASRRVAQRPAARRRARWRPRPARGVAPSRTRAGNRGRRSCRRARALRRAKPSTVRRWDRRERQVGAGRRNRLRPPNSEPEREEPARADGSRPPSSRGRPAGAPTYGQGEDLEDPALDPARVPLLVGDPAGMREIIHEHAFEPPRDVAVVDNQVQLLVHGRSDGRGWCCRR